MDDPARQELDTSSLFAEYTDPVSGVRSWILDRHVAPLQQGFYFVNQPFSGDHRYLWFYAAFPPAPQRCLGVVDFHEQAVRLFPETGFSGASPWIHPDTGEAYWAAGASVWRRGPGDDDPVVPVNTVPEEVIAGRHLTRLATHLTISADGREFLIDAIAGRESLIGSLPLDGGDFQLWGRHERFYDHGQFCPSDPDLAMVAEDHFTDPVTGERIRYTDRLWLIRRDEAIRPVFPEPTIITHEWWDESGECIYAVGAPGDRPDATWRIDPATGEASVACERWHWHAHDWDHGRYFVGDRRGEFYRGCPSSVWFVNTDSGREVAVVSHNPEHFTPGRQYHIDPHPRFSPDGSWVVFTTTVLGRVDLAIARTADLLECTS
jgi:hypothetical protein